MSPEKQRGTGTVLGLEITPAALQHDLDRRVGLVFAVNSHQLWSATIGGQETAAVALQFHR